MTHLRFKSNIFLSVILFLTCNIAGPLFAQTLTGQVGVPTTQAVVTLANLSPVTDAGAGPPATPTNFLAVADNGTQDPPFPGGAVGPNHIVSTLDHVIRIQNRTGSNLFTVSVTNFWAATGPNSGPRGAFDTKVVYDPYSDRWLMTAVTDYNTNTSAVLAGVTQTGDPSGAWNLYRVNINTNAVAPKWVNYPSLGFNKDWIAVGVIAYDIGTGPQEWQLYAFGKTNLYANGNGAYRRFGNTDTATYGVVQEPCATYDNTLSNLYLVAEIDGNSGSNGVLRLFYIDGPTGAEVLHVGADASTPNPWDSNPPSCDFGPQLGSTNRICLDNSRLQNAVYRNGSIWTTQAIFLPAGAVTRSAVQWWQIAPTGVIQQRGRIDDVSGQLFYAYPSIAVNQMNDALIGCAMFSASNYASAYYALRSHADATNTFQTPVLLKAGDATFARSSPPLRWGDHTTTVVDPNNNLDFWTIQEYATSTNSQSRWGTWWGRVIGESVDLSIAKAGSPSPAPVASNLTYTITVTNLSTAPAASVMVTDTLPASVTFVSASASQGSCTNVSGTVTCNLSTVASNSGASVQIVVVPTAIGILTNVASVSAAATDSNLANNVVTNIVSAFSNPDLSVSPSSHDFGAVTVGTTAQTAFTITNRSLALLNGTASVSHGSFAITSGGSYSVPPFGSASVLVSFTPFTTGVFNDELIFASNGGDSTNALAGSGAVAPTAGFTGSPTNGAASLLVSFADASTGTITNRSWTFGDGGTSTASSPSHNYTNAGTFSVNLTVFGPVGSNKLTRSNYITVTNLVVTVPVAGFTASPTNGSAPLLVSFADASTGSITNRSWTFGDGGISSANNPSHTYTNVGAFSVSLTVLGPGGSGVLTRTNYIMVTNVVNVAPVVSIVRPADGMVYPPLTNLAINIVANASDSDGISKIEFWDGTNKLGEASASPATNVLSAPAFGSHILAARAIDGLGMTNTSAVITITVGGKNSPLGDWEVTVSGKDKGLGFLTFSDDATASGYEIRLGTFGLDTLSGAWDFDAKSNLTGLFIEQLGGTTNWTGTLAGKAKSLKSVSASVTTSNGVYKWKGVPATTFPDLSGMWTGQVTVAKIAAGVGYAITTNATNAGVFDVAALTATNAVIGRFIVTSRGKMDGYITIASKQTILSGTFRASKSSVSLKGRNEDGVLVEVRIAKE